MNSFDWNIVKHEGRRGDWIAVTLLAQWLEDIGLLLNSSKTQVLFIRPRGVHDAPSSIYCRGQILETTRTAKYLGVIIDDELSWRQHVDHIGKKATQAIGQLWRHGRALSLRARKMWYVSLVQSHILYASNCFSPSLTSHLLQQLTKISKAGVRAIFQLPRRTPTGPLRARLHLSSLQCMYRRKWLIFVFRCLHSSASGLFHNFFTLKGHSREILPPFFIGLSCRVFPQEQDGIIFVCI